MIKIIEELENIARIVEEKNPEAFLRIKKIISELKENKK